MTIAADVLLLAAGFGKRLRPLTDSIPKPLVAVGGRPLIDRNLELIARSGLPKVFINLHYLGQKIRDYVDDGSRWGLEVVYSEEPILLDTGGAIKNIEPQLQQPQLITVNSDLLIGPDFSLNQPFAAHSSCAAQPLLTMVLRPDPAAEAYGSIGIDSSGRVVSFLGTDYGFGAEVQRLMFLGIMVINRKVIEQFMPDQGIFSITRDTIRKILESGEHIHSMIYHGYWNDIGTPDRLNQASKDVEGIFGTS